MPKLVGSFSSFKDLDKISVQDLIRWIPHPPNPFYIENYLANRIFYPQTIPQKEEDLEIELAILREALRLNPDFYNRKYSKFLIPQTLLENLPNLGQVIWAYLDAYKPKGIAYVFLKNAKAHQLGTVLIPDILNKQGLIELVVERKKYSIKLGNLTVIPCMEERCDISFFAKNAEILGKNELSLEIFGGNLGIVVDARGV